ncbi:hypothetical protein AB1Y20_007788 [Prymnesium parvum]|uniref:DUF6817 domain-containing protein n=1 Tax=Prymnesium parvum TaxID=97485 RepID=A0AB34ITR5_PRYPA
MPSAIRRLAAPLAPAARRALPLLVPSPRAVSTAAHGRSPALPSLVESLLREDVAALDSHAPEVLRRLRGSEAPLVWHKHSSFAEHLRGVWAMLVVWRQPQAWCRLGLCHSVYSNSFVSMNLFDPRRDRHELAEMIGEEAEELVYKFCSIDRQRLEEAVLEEGKVRPEGYTFRHIHTGEPLEVSGIEACAMVSETLADEMEQRFGWQSDLEAGLCAASWPGLFQPTLRMSRTSRLAVGLRESGLLADAALPPIFDHCARVISPEDEAAARELYWQASTAPSLEATSQTTAQEMKRRVRALSTCSQLNPFVAEPHLVRAQLLLQLQAWDEAERAAIQGVDLLGIWATQWDKRMPWNAWVNWGRCLAFQASLHEWPTTHGGIESLGAVHSAQRFRSLNVSRSQEEKA